MSDEIALYAIALLASFSGLAFVMHFRVQRKKRLITRTRVTGRGEMNNRISESLRREAEERRRRQSQQSSTDSLLNPLNPASFVWIGADYGSGSESGCSHDSGGSSSDSGSCSSD